MTDLASRLKRLPKDKRSQLLNQLRNNGETESAPAAELRKREYGQHVVTSFQQEQLWFIDQMATDGKARNNVALLLRLEDDLHVDALQRALQELVNRHEPLRTAFQQANGSPQQFIVPHLDVDLPVIDLSQHATEELEAKFQEVVKTESSQPFSFETAPLFRARLLKKTEREHWLLWVAHHILWDPGSTAVFTKELTALYEAFKQGHPSPLAPLNLQYADFAIWQREYLQGDKLKQLNTYWKKQLASLEVTELPTDFPRPAQMGFEGARVYHEVGGDLLAGIKELGKKQGTTLYMTMLAAFKALLQQLTRSNDIIVGTPGENRMNQDVEAMIGFFVNMLVMRTDLSGDPTFSELLNRVRETALGAYTNQDLPFERVVAAVNPPRDPSRHPLFQIELTVQAAVSDFANSLQGLVQEHQLVHDSGSRFDMSVIIHETAQGLMVICEYNTSLYTEATIHRLLERFEAVLEQVVQAPEKRLSELSLLTGEEQHLLTQVFCHGEEQPVVEATLHEVFEQRVAEAPHAVAIVDHEHEITFEALNRRANQLARQLQAIGMQPEQRVAICLERSHEMIAAVLAALKAGGAYVPLDPTYPQERLNYILHDAQAPILITQERLADRFDQGERMLLLVDREEGAIHAQEASNLQANVAPTQLAYLIYTSGSTGKPKGVMIEHRSVTNFALQSARLFEITKDDRLIQFASLGFDVSVFEVFTALLAGIPMVIANDMDRRSPEQLTALMIDKKVTVAELPPALLPLLNPNELPQLRLLSVGGEKFAGDLVGAWATPSRRMVNGYGPTETTVAVTLYECEGEWSVMPPIGRPMTNHRAYVLDEHLNPVPIGVAGELHIAGVGVARGYLNRPELTAEKFVANPYSTDPNYSRLYKTGDVVRWLPDGHLEILGRVDRQIKIRGFRIELGEIESVIASHDDVKQVIVEPFQNADHQVQLVAYVVMEEGVTLDVPAVREVLLDRLPSYMVPSRLLQVPEIPLTPNGKVDRRALPKPEDAEMDHGASFKAPETEVERKISEEIFAKLLGVSKIGTQDNFFDLGGNSLQATQVISRLRDLFQAEISLVDFFQLPTVANLAALVEKYQEEQSKQRSQLFDVLDDLESMSEEEAEAFLLSMSGEGANE